VGKIQIPNLWWTLDGRWGPNWERVGARMIFFGGSGLVCGFVAGCVTGYRQSRAAERPNIRAMDMMEKGTMVGASACVGGCVCAVTWPLPLVPLAVLLIAHTK
jgi:hypothetical protein